MSLSEAGPPAAAGPAVQEAPRSVRSLLGYDDFVTFHPPNSELMGLKGSLAELPLSDLIEMTSLGGKTGLLVICDEEGAVAGEIAFRAGRLAGARCGDLHAEKAFYALLTIKEGTFDFDPGAQIDDDDCNLGTESLLMEGMRRIDEIQRLRSVLPAPAIVRYVGGFPNDPVENRVLGYLGPGARELGDIVDGVLVGGDADEYDALRALQRLGTRGVVRIEVPHDAHGAAIGPAMLPQPELER